MEGITFEALAISVFLLVVGFTILGFEAGRMAARDEAGERKGGEQG